MGILIKAPARRREGPPPVNVLAEKGESAEALHIREVVRITGLRREQLYMWQRRYGFPAPLRDSFGDRVYPPDQVARLRLIKQLLSEGWRAAKCKRSRSCASRISRNGCYARFAALLALRATRARCCWPRRPTIRTSSASRFSSFFSTPKASAASRWVLASRRRKSPARL